MPDIAKIIHELRKKKQKRWKVVTKQVAPGRFSPVVVDVSELAVRPGRGKKKSRS